MRNLIYHLKPRLYLSFELKKTVDTEHFKIYIDESILYDQQDTDMIAKRFIVAFYTIKASDIGKLNNTYKQIIYSNKATHEKKSNQVSDKTNRLALEISQNYLVNATVFERSAYDYNQFGSWKKNMLLSLELLSYIQPIKDILFHLKEHAKTAKIMVDVIIDRTSQNCIEPCLRLNKNLLERLAEEVSDEEKDIAINYQTADSKESYGIQVADMLAGAYRKEMSYHQNEPLINLIPFPYQRKVLDSELQRNPEFLKILGQIVYDQMPQIQIPAPKSIFNNKTIVENKCTYHPITKLKEFFKRKYNDFHIGKNTFLKTMYLLHKLESINSNKERVQVIAVCSKLNKHLGTFAKGMGIKPNDFALTLSQKTNDKNYEKTLNNLRHNLDQLEEMCNDKFERRFIMRELKVFNTQIKKYC